MNTGSFHCATPQVSNKLLETRSLKCPSWAHTFYPPASAFQWGIMGVCHHAQLHFFNFMGCGLGLFELVSLWILLATWLDFCPFLNWRQLVFYTYSPKIKEWAAFFAITYFTPISPFWSKLNYELAFSSFGLKWLCFDYAIRNILAVWFLNILPLGLCVCSHI